MFSAGNTGAGMAVALLTLGRIPGIDRPAIAILLPNLKGSTVLLDAGANVDVPPACLVQYAVMGSIYAHELLGIAEPRVGIININSFSRTTAESHLRGAASSFRPRSRPSVCCSRSHR